MFPLLLVLFWKSNWILQKKNDTLAEDRFKLTGKLFSFKTFLIGIPGFYPSGKLEQVQKTIIYFDLTSLNNAGLLFKLSD